MADPAAERVRGAGSAVRERRFGGRLDCLSFGAGPPLVVLPGLPPRNENPTGLGRRAMLRILGPFRHSRTVHYVSRRTGPERATGMSAMADELVTALHAEFDGPVDTLGISAGASVALTLAARHPDAVGRLVAAGSACRLCEDARDAMAEVADLYERGARVEAARAIARAQFPGPLAGPAGRLIDLAERLTAGRVDDRPDMVSGLRAWRDFDVTGELGAITAPTLLLGGGRDRLFTPDLFRHTARRIPLARLVLYPRRGHGGAYAAPFHRDVLAFLDDRTTGG